MDIEDRVHDMEKHLRTINHELGDIVGQLKWVFRILFVILGLLITHFFI
jgi:hypothetical protein